VVNDKFVLYKSIKMIFKRFGNPMGRHTIVTFNNEKLSLFRAPIKKVVEITGFQITK